MNKQTEKADAGKYYRENFKSYLVAKDDNFFIETFCEEGKIDCVPVKLKGQYWPKSARFKLRYLTDKERQETNKTDVYKFPGETTRSSPFQHLLNRLLDEILVLDADEFNRVSNSAKRSKPLFIA